MSRGISPRGRRWLAGSLWIVALWGALAVGAAAGGSDPQALRLIEAYNGRSFGSPGWRRVQLELKSGAVVTRSFLVANLWQRTGEVVHTLFVLERPEGLQGTNYLLVEDPREPAGMKVFLHLPAGKRRVLQIQPSHFDEGLLGSDFGYRDLRMKIPVAGYDFRLRGKQTLLKQSVWVVDATPSAGGARISSWARSRLYLLEKAPVLLGADHFLAPSDRRPAKTLRVHGFRQIDGAWTETRMVMAAADGRTSVLTLQGFKAAVQEIDATLFVPETLPTVAGRLADLRLARPRSPEGGR